MAEWHTFDHSKTGTESYLVVSSLHDPLPLFLLFSFSGWQEPVAFDLWAVKTSPPPLPPGPMPKAQGQGLAPGPGRPGLPAGGGDCATRILEVEGSRWSEGKKERLREVGLSRVEGFQGRALGSRDGDV